MTNGQNEQFKAISDKLDKITIILLAQAGLTRKEIASILDISEKTVQRMFAGHFNKMKWENK